MKRRRDLFIYSDRPKMMMPMTTTNHKLESVDRELLLYKYVSQTSRYMYGGRTHSEDLAHPEDKILPSGILVIPSNKYEREGESSQLILCYRLFFLNFQQ